LKKKATLWILACALLIGVGLPALAQKAADPARIVRLHGWVVDDGTAMRHANAESKDAILQSFEEGVPLVFVTKDGDTYLLAEQEEAAEKVGQAWDVIGMLGAEGKLRVGTYIQPRTKKAPAPEDAEEDAD
jgi:hypothetical protein